MSRYYSLAVAALTAIVVMLFILSAVKFDIISSDGLIRNKDLLSAIQSLATTMLLCIGAVLSYYKFFKGRTFTPKAEISADVSVHRTDEEHYLHVLTLTFKNIGVATIWQPKPVVSILLHGPNRKETIEHIPPEDWTFPDQIVEGVSRSASIDPEERAYFFVSTFVSTAIWAVTYNVSVVDDTRHSWGMTKTISNYVASQK